MASSETLDLWVNALVDLHEIGFGGRPRGKYRISRKFLRQLLGRNRIDPDIIAQLSAELFERGYALIDLETHFVVQGQKLFNSYRRVTEAALETVIQPALGGNDQSE